MKVTLFRMFIMYYFRIFRAELMQLQEMLDPDDKNICVSKSTFYSVMNDWAARISSSNTSDNFQEAFTK